MRKMSSFSIEEISEESFSTLDESMERPAFEKEEYIDILGRFKNIFEEDCKMTNKSFNQSGENSNYFTEDEEEEIKLNLFELDNDDLEENKDFKASTKIFKIRSKHNDRIYQKFKVEIFEEPDIIVNNLTEEINAKEEKNTNDTISLDMSDEMDKEEINKITLSNLEVENFIPVRTSYNLNGNYQNYLGMIMESIPVLLEQDYTNFINERKVHLPELKENKKTLLLDLDETLIHADFEEKFPVHDKEITFFEDGEEYKVNINLRPKVKEFLKKVSELFEVIVFTAGIKEYADAVLDFLDPEKSLIKHRLYRNSCICVNNAVHIKDLRIFSNRNLENIFIVDNSFYSFVNQPDNGILINSFYHNKDDNELINLFYYLRNYLLSSEDVRKSNEQIFNFKTMTEKARRNKSLRRYWYHLYLFLINEKLKIEIYSYFLKFFIDWLLVFKDFRDFW